MSKTLLVLGGSSDMALAYIRKYQGNYNTIVAQYFSHIEELNKLQEEIEATLIPVQADLSDQNSVQNLISYLNENKIEVDYILHCPAGKPTLARIGELDVDILRQEMQIEVYSILEIIKSAVSHMEEQKFGRICFVLSSVTERPVQCQTSYVVAKYALLGVMKSLAAELADQKITVNAISPTMTDTKFIDNISPFVIKQRLKESPLKRLAVPEDLTGAIALFLSDENEFITGENILISGGSIIN